MTPPATPEPDHYAVLGVPRDATARQITAAYRALLRALHPDTATDTAPPTGRERLAAVIAAYRTLHDPERRTAYDHAHAHAPLPVAPTAPRPGRAVTQPELRIGPVRRHR